MLVSGFIGWWHVLVLDKMFDVITCKAPKKGPASSVILADGFVNPMADPPKAPHKVCPHNTPLTSVSTNFLLHYRSTTPMLIPNFSYHLVLSQVWQEMGQSPTSLQQEEIDLGSRHLDPSLMSTKISPAPKHPPSLILLCLPHIKTLRWPILVHQVPAMMAIQMQTHLGTILVILSKMTFWMI